MTSPDPERNPFFGKPDEYLLWAQNKKNRKFSPTFCARHWMPCPVEGKPGLLVSVVLMTEMFAYMPDDLVKPGVDPSTAMNSWMADQVIPLCCKIGNEKMKWLWWLVTKESGLCRAKYSDAYPEQKVSIRVCWRLESHGDEHEWDRPFPRSVFDLMDEVNPGVLK